MACDGHRSHYLKQAAPLGSRVAQALGGGDPAKAVTLLEIVYRTARNREIRWPNSVAEGGQDTLFADMQAQGGSRPEHTVGSMGVATTRAYAELQRTLVAAREGTTLPPLAFELVENLRLYGRDLASVRSDWGHQRCPHCGRWSGTEVQHICPMTVTMASLAGRVAEQLGVPVEAYSLQGEARAGGAWAGVVAATHRHPRTPASLQHTFSGAVITVPLDQVPDAAAGGYVPLDWPPLFQWVRGADGRPVPVANLCAGVIPWPATGESVESRLAQEHGFALAEGSAVDSAGDPTDPCSGIAYAGRSNRQAQTLNRANELLETDRSAGWLTRAAAMLQETAVGRWEQCPVCGRFQSPNGPCVGCPGSLPPSEATLMGVLGLAAMAAVSGIAPDEQTGETLLSTALRSPIGLLTLAELGGIPDAAAARRQAVVGILAKDLALHADTRAAVGTALASAVAMDPRGGGTADWLRAIRRVDSSPWVTEWIEATAATELPGGPLRSAYPTLSDHPPVPPPFAVNESIPIEVLQVVSGPTTHRSMDQQRGIIEGWSDRTQRWVASSPFPQLRPWQLALSKQPNLAADTIVALTQNDTFWETIGTPTFVLRDIAVYTQQSPNQRGAVRLCPVCGSLYAAWRICDHPQRGTLRRYSFARYLVMEQSCTPNLTMSQALSLEPHIDRLTTTEEDARLFWDDWRMTQSRTRNSPHTGVNRMAGLLIQYPPLYRDALLHTNVGVLATQQIGGLQPHEAAVLRASSDRGLRAGVLEWLGHENPDYRTSMGDIATYYHDQEDVVTALWGGLHSRDDRVWRHTESLLGGTVFAETLLNWWAGGTLAATEGRRVERLLAHMGQGFDQALSRLSSADPADRHAAGRLVGELVRSNVSIEALVITLVEDPHTPPTIRIPLFTALARSTTPRAQAALTGASAVSDLSTVVQRVVSAAVERQVEAAARRTAAVLRRRSSGAVAVVAAGYLRSTRPTTSYETNFDLFHTIYRQAGQVPLPYYTVDALDGAATSPNGHGFGVELEFQGNVMSSRAIAAELHRLGLISSPVQASYHSGRGRTSEWRFERDSSVSGGEVVSPLLYDTPEAWAQLAQICAVIRENGGTVNERCGGHVHVGAAGYGGNPAHYARLMTLFARSQDVLFRLATRPGATQHRGQSYCSPIAGSSSNYQQHSIADFRGMTRTSALNLRPITEQERTSHVEFRLFDGTIDPATIQAQIRLAVALTDAVPRLTYDQVNSLPLEALRYHGQQRPGLESLESESLGFRRLVDLICTRDRDKKDLTHLFARTPWLH